MCLRFDLMAFAAAGGVDEPLPPPSQNTLIDEEKLGQLFVTFWRNKCPRAVVSKPAILSLVPDR